MGGKPVIVVPGTRFNRLELLSEVASLRRPSGTVVRRVLCRCDCGNKTTLDLGAFHNEHTGSCGCLQKEAASRNGQDSRTHGLSQSQTYRIWNAMKQRCSNPNDSYYHLYGARGVTVCQRWRDSFQAFVEDMGEKPSREYSIDRYPDQNGPYAPGNCRWATMKEQQRNRRNNVMLTIGDTTLCVAEWAEQQGIRVGMVRDRLRSGWSGHDAVMTPKGTRRNT
jgi:hypothetical protein